MIKQYKLRFYNFKLVILLTAISLFGVQLVASASPDLRNKQLLGGTGKAELLGHHAKVFQIQKIHKATPHYNHVPA